jgi:hypothetical protein
VFFDAIASVLLCGNVRKNRGVDITSLITTKIGEEIKIRVVIYLPLEVT